MKRILIVSLLLLVTVVFATGAYAADNQRVAQFGGITATAVADASSGNCAEVDSDGSLQTQPKGSDTIVISYEGLTSGSATPGEVLISGTAYVKSIVVSGVSAGDYCEIYAGTTRTAANLKLDPIVGTAVDTITISLPGGAKFTDGVYVYPKDTEVKTTITYSQ